MPIYAIPDLTGGPCVQAVTDAVKALDPAAAVSVDLQGKTAEIACRAEPAAVKAALHEAGYAASIMGD